MVVAGNAHAQNAVRPFKDWRPTSFVDTRRAEPRMSCDAVLSLTTYEFSILSAQTVPMSGSVPAFCRIFGQILPEIRFELSLPVEWNGRLYMFGNGGFAGEALDAPARVTNRDGALQRGFAVVQTFDAGPLQALHGAGDVPLRRRYRHQCLRCRDAADRMG
jgi:feruloyl esterase